MERSKLIGFFVGRDANSSECVDGILNISQRHTVQFPVISVSDSVRTANDGPAAIVTREHQRPADIEIRAKVRRRRSRFQVWPTAGRLVNSTRMFVGVSANIRCQCSGCDKFDAVRHAAQIGNTVRRGKCGPCRKGNPMNLIVVSNAVSTVHRPRIRRTQFVTAYHI